MIASPLIIVGDGQVELFANPAALEASIEAEDLQLFRAYDSEGRLLALTGEHRGGSALGIHGVQNGLVTVGVPTEGSSRSEELRVALLDWWTRTHGSPDAAAWPLQELVDAIAERDGVTA